MQEIRFSQPAPVQVETLKQASSSEEPKKDKKKYKFLYFALLFLKFSLVLVLLYAGLVGSRYFFDADNTDKNAYSAIFLENEQVYFGKILENKKEEIILKDVYYLQNAGTNFSPDGASLQGSTFTLVKLGQELHGPTDEMYINKEKVLFYEYLRPDSQVVRTIENYKKK